MEESVNFTKHCGECGFVYFIIKLKVILAEISRLYLQISLSKHL